MSYFCIIKWHFSNLCRDLKNHYWEKQLDKGQISMDTFFNKTGGLPF